MDTGGLLALTTGDIESFNARIRKEKWRFLKPPEHLHYFSSRALKKMLINYDFEVIYNRYCGTYMSLDNIAYKLLVLNKKGPGLYNLLQKIGLQRFCMYFNFFDIRYIIAQKV